MFFIIQAFEGLHAQFSYSIVGHSGSGAEALRIVDWGKPPTSAQDKLKVVEHVRTHPQYCQPGDCTLEGTEKGIQDCLSEAADEHFVFVISDADLERYGISPQSWNDIIVSETRCGVYVVLISDNENEAERILECMSPGHAHVCDQTENLAQTFMAILKHNIL